jgi:hypothetical protein
LSHRRKAGDEQESGGCSLKSVEKAHNYGNYILLMEKAQMVFMTVMTKK